MFRIQKCTLRFRVYILIIKLIGFYMKLLLIYRYAFFILIYRYTFLMVEIFKKIFCKVEKKYFLVFGALKKNFWAFCKI